MLKNHSDYLDISRKYIDEENYNKAIYYLNKLLRTDPENAYAHYLKGVVFQELGNLNKADSEYRKAISIIPDYKEAITNLADVLNEQQKSEDALKLYEYALSIDSTYREAWFGKGLALRDIEKYEEALLAFNQVNTIEEDPAAHFYLGLILADLERSDEALGEFEQSIKLDPEYVSAFYYMGELLQKLERYEEAASAFDKANTLDSSYNWSWFKMGECLMKLGRPEKALNAFEKAIRLRADLPEYYSSKGEALAIMGRDEEALAAFDESISINPNNPDGKFLNITKLPSKKFLSYLKHIYKRNYSMAFLTKGHILGKLGKFEESILNCEKSIEIEPSDIAYNEKGIGLVETGRYEEALATFEKALELKDDYVPGIRRILAGKGRALLFLGRYGEAAECFIEATKLNIPDDASAYNLAGYSLVGKRDYNKAVGYCEKAYSIDNDEPGIIINLALALLRRGKGTDNSRAIKMLNKLLENNLSSSDKVYVYALLGMKDKMMELLMEEADVLKEIDYADLEFQQYRDDPDFKKVF